MRKTKNERPEVWVYKFYCSYFGDGFFLFNPLLQWVIDLLNKLFNCFFYSLPRRDKLFW
uniref:Uncharacterized protein n=1 Tax=Daphnia magna TaxID=35525 RepID=A0A0P5E4X2_9CRUS